jgi:perosamine synthetase
MISHSQPWITESELDATKSVLSSGMLFKGTISIALEKQMANYLNKSFSLATGNGTQAMMLLLSGMGIGPGDEVILPSYVCDKVYFGVIRLGARPVLCDIGNQWVMTYDSVKKVVSDKTAAIILVHIFGINAWDNDFENLNIPIIEDLCQSFGHIDPFKRTGRYSRFSFTSFHGTKCIQSGEGGMLFCEDEQVFNTIKEKVHTWPEITHYSDLQAAPALAILNRYDDILSIRNTIASRFMDEFPKDLIDRSKIPSLNSMFFRFPLKWEMNFTILQTDFYKEGIAIRKGVDSLIHRQLEISDAEFTETVNTFKSTVSIPILPQLRKSQIDHIIRTTNNIWNKYN